MTKSKIVKYSSDGSRSVDTGNYISKAKLAEIADRIRARTAQAVIDNGRDLTLVKQSMDHGEFTKWIDTEFSMTARTAQNCMLAAEWADGKSEIVSHLPLTTIYMLAAPSTPKEITTEVISFVEAGKPIKPKQIEERIKAARKPRTKAPEPEPEPEPETKRRRRRTTVADVFNANVMASTVGITMALPRVEIPDLDPEAAKKAIREIKNAEQALRILRRQIEQHQTPPDPTPPPSDDEAEGGDLPEDSPDNPEITTDDDPLAIPSQFKREPSEKKPPHSVSEDVRAKREAHRTAVECRKLLEKDRKSKVRKRRTTAKTKKSTEDMVIDLANSVNKALPR